MISEELILYRNFKRQDILDGFSRLFEMRSDNDRILSLCSGFFRAYHMNKEKWISIALDGSIPDDTIKMLLDISYDSTSSHKKKNSTDDSEVKQ